MGGKTPAGEGPSATSAGYFFQRLFLYAALFLNITRPELLPVDFLYGLRSSANLYCLRDF